MKKLFYNQQYIDQKDIQAVSKALSSNFITTGPFVEKFEFEFSKKVSVKFSTVLNSGTSALFLANKVLLKKPNEVVLVPALTFSATANAVRLNGAEVVFVDCDPSTGLITPENVEKAIILSKKKFSKVPSGIWVTHYAGQVVDLKEIHNIVKNKNMWIAEDACHALGSEYFDNNSWKKVGSCQYSKLSVFSFHAVKNITMGEGGVVSTNDKKIHSEINLLRSHGIIRNRDLIQCKKNLFEIKNKFNQQWFYDIFEIGFNFRIPDILCALGVSQLKKLRKFVQKKKKLVAHYDRLLKPFDEKIKPLQKIDNNKVAWHLYPVLIDFNIINISKVDLFKYLAKKNIFLQVHYIPLPLISYYKNRYRFKDLNKQFSGAINFYKKEISLPLFYNLSLNEITKLIKILKKVTI